MKQAKLVKLVYQACLDKDPEVIAKLRQLEFKKIFKHKAQHKPFDAKWTAITKL
jgi:hypothetical protein